MRWIRARPAPRLGPRRPLEPLYSNGIVDFGRSFREVDDALRRLVEQVRTSAKTPLMTVLLEGRAHTGKTALAARTAVTSEFPFVRLLSADSMIGFSESAKCQAIQKVLDSYKSPLSIVVIDDVERLIEYTPVGPRFSNTVLQTSVGPTEEGTRRRKQKVISDSDDVGIESSGGFATYGRV